MKFTTLLKKKIAIRFILKPVRKEIMKLEKDKIYGRKERRMINKLMWMLGGTIDYLKHLLSRVERLKLKL